GCGSGSMTTRLNSQASSNSSGTPGFALLVTPPVATTLSTAPVIFDVTINPDFMFHDNVRINVSGGNGNFVVQNPTPDTLAVQGGAVQTSFTVPKPRGARAGRGANLTVTATSGAVTQTATVTVQAQ